MAGISTGIGLTSGMDYASLVSQLMQLERQPQTLLRTKLSDTQVDAAAYRAVNSSVAALHSAAEALTKATTWGAVKATSSSPTVTASAAAGASTGSVTFTVDRLAATHSVIGDVAWNPPAAATTLTIADADNDRASTTVSLAAGATLGDAIKAINAAGAGVTASAVGTGSGARLQLTSMTSGLDGAFTVSGGPTFKVLAQGVDAQLTVGSADTYSFPVTSNTNTFTDLLAGTTLTVSEKGTTTTLTVATDPAAVAGAVQALVTAANNALTSVSGYSYNGTGSTAALRGDSTLRQLASDILTAVSSAIGADDSAATAGLQLTRDGKVAFNAETFTARLKADPALAQQLVTGTAAVPGVAQRLLEVTKVATDATTGTLTLLAKSKDSEATQLQKRIDEWDIRLELRQQNLTRQFTAMESALGTLNNQSTWLSTQLAQLPSWSSSDKN
ncbi:flagellar filament capping protein FliD [Geodermatophilus sp. SYSU D00742]